MRNLRYLLAQLTSIPIPILHRAIFTWLRGKLLSLKAASNTLKAFASVPLKAVFNITLRTSASIPLKAVFNNALKAALATLLLLSFNATAFAKSDILIFKPAGDHFEKVAAGLADELADEFNYQTIPLHKNATADDLYQFIRIANPKAIVLMGNRQLGLLKEMQSEHLEEKFPPTVAVAALYMDWVLADSKNVTGILYEVPAVTSLVSLRAISKHPIKRVGVLYREGMGAMIERNIQYCQSEGIELIATKLSLSDAKNPRKVRKALKALSKKPLDAIWVSNDSGLLNQTLITKAWIPVLSNYDKPVVVGVETLIQSKLNFGNFSVFPDDTGLGAQTAELIFNLQDRNWKIKTSVFEQPISVMKHLNTRISRQRGVKFNENELTHLDKLVE